MSLREKVQRLTMAGEGEGMGEEGKSEVLAPELPTVPQPAEDTHLLEAVAELERNIFRLAGMIDKTEAEKKDLQKLAQDVEAQRLAVGKMLVGLEAAVKTIPANIQTSIHNCLGASVEAVAAATRKSLAQVLAQGAQDITSAAGKASTAASYMYHARRAMGWKTVALNLVAYPLFALLLLSLFVGVRPWNLRTTADERKLIGYGRLYQEIYPRLSEKTKKEINHELKRMKTITQEQ